MVEYIEYPDQEPSPEDLVVLNDALRDIFGLPRTEGDRETVLALRRRFSKLDPRIVALHMRLADIFTIIELLLKKLCDLTTGAKGSKAKEQGEVAIWGASALIMIAALVHLPPKLRRKAHIEALKKLGDIDKVLKKLGESE